MAKASPRVVMLTSVIVAANAEYYHQLMDTGLFDKDATLELVKIQANHLWTISVLPVIHKEVLNYE